MKNLRVSPQEAAKELLCRREARKSLLHFTTYTFPGYEPEPFHRMVAEYLDRVRKGSLRRLMIFSPPQHGKLIAHDEPILTVQGWKRHGDILPNDYVFGRNGQPVRVIAISEDGVANRVVTFTDGTAIRCHAAHEWLIFDRNRKYQGARVLETDAMMATGVWLGPRGKRGGRARYQVDTNTKVDYPRADLPLHPYVLGVWLGDGTAKKNCIVHHPDDGAILDKMGRLGYPVTAHSVHSTTGIHTSYCRELYGALMEMDMFDNKHIPDRYLRASEDQRLELLAGLVDADGYMYAETGRITFSNADKALIDQVHDLVVGLGWRTSICSFPPTTSSSGIVGKQTIYQLCFNPTTVLPVALERKRGTKTTPVQRRRGIRDIEKCDPVPGRCIQVEGGTYLVGRTLLPTHNSELTSVRFPPYWFGNYPEARLILTSYASGLAHGKSWEARSVMESPLYQNLYDARTDEKSRARDFWRIQGTRGQLVAAGVGGPITGHTAHLGIIDDPIENWQQAQSDTQRETIWNWYRSTFRTRVSEDGAIVLIQTRWHEDDLAGRLLREKTEDWTVLRFPAVAETQEERDHHNHRMGLPVGEPDPLGRSPGEPLCPKRFSKDELERIRRTVGSLHWSALYQGAPTLPEGNRFKREWFGYVDFVPEGASRVRFWDKAATAGGKGAYTAGVKMALLKGTFYIEDVVRGRWSAGEREAIIRRTAEADGREVQVWMEQEPGSGGKESAQATIQNLAGFAAYAERATGSKDARLEPLAAQCEIGNVKLVRAHWNPAYLDELCSIPSGRWRDQADASAGAFNRLTQGQVKLGYVEIPLARY